MQEPQIIVFLLHIAGAAALLIWAVRLVRTGVERAFSTQLRQWLRHSADNRIAAAGSGLLAAIFLQSSTAVAILISNFVGAGRLAAAAGLAILLGADLGSAAVTQILLHRQEILIPLLLLLGVSLFLRGANGSARQIGRILIGLALIFLSLDLIRAATAPMVGAPATGAVMEYLGRDTLTAFLIGAVFAWAVHSSVAAILLFVTLTGQGILPISAAAAMVLGANLGGGFIAYVLTRAAPVLARQMVMANLILRGGGAVVMLLVLSVAPEILARLGASPAQQAINLHLAYNLVLAAIGLVIIGPITVLVAKIVTDNPGPARLTASALDPTALDRPNRGLDCAARELLAMGQKIEVMMRSASPLYDGWDDIAARAIEAEDRAIKDMHLDLKLYLARLGKSGLEEDHSRKSMDLASLSTSLEAASETIVGMLGLAKRLHLDGVRFSAKGRAELEDFADRVLGNVQLALNVMMNQNPDEARELVAAKDKVRMVEQKLQRKHLGRLRKGVTESIETSNIHQETLRALKQINTSFSVVGYPILARSGDLLSSRLA